MIRHAAGERQTDGWRRASRCTPQNNCVEIKVGSDDVGVRDSKNVGAAPLVFSHHQWAAFIGEIVR
jgi:hypothetical protein